MDDSAMLLAPDGQSAVGRDFAAGDGLSLTVSWPPGRRLLKASLLIQSSDASAWDETYPGSPATAALTDGGSLASQINQPWLWASVEWGEERALAGISINVPAANPPLAFKTGARLRLFSQGNWLPLAPLDVLPTGRRQDFPPRAASGLMAEMLREGKAGDQNTGVLIPGAVAGSGLSLRFTRQACRVSAHIGDGAPFFSHGDPLPASPVDVEGLARALNRYRNDNPDSASVPLDLRAAGQQSLRIVAFSAELEALPPPPPPAPSPAQLPHLPREGERSWLPDAGGAKSIARLGDPSHSLALHLAALPAGTQLSSLGLFIRVLDADIEAELSLHAPDGAGPRDDALATWTWTPRPDETPPDEATWYTTRLPEALALGGDWWLHCRLKRGRLLWYADSPRPTDALGAFSRRLDGPWLPLDAPADSPWLQVRIGILDPGT